MDSFFNPIGKSYSLHLSGLDRIKKEIKTSSRLLSKSSNLNFYTWAAVQKLDCFLEEEKKLIRFCLFTKAHIFCNRKHWPFLLWPTKLMHTDWRPDHLQHHKVELIHNKSQHASEDGRSIWSGIQEKLLNQMWSRGLSGFSLTQLIYETWLL